MRDPDLRGADEPRRMAVLPPPRFFEMGGSVTIDLAADRSLMEAVALSWMTPFALGWFWYVNAITPSPAHVGAVSRATAAARRQKVSAIRAPISLWMRLR